MPLRVICASDRAKERHASNSSPTHDHDHDAILLCNGNILLQYDHGPMNATDRCRQFNEDIHSRCLDTCCSSGCSCYTFRHFSQTFLSAIATYPSHDGFTNTPRHSTLDLVSLKLLPRSLRKSLATMRQSNAPSQHLQSPTHRTHLLTSLSAPSLARPTRSPVVPSSRPVCTYIYQATECELAPLMSQISNVHPATLS